MQPDVPRRRRWRIALLGGAFAATLAGASWLRADRLPAAAPAAHEPPSWLTTWSRYDEAIPDDVMLREDLERAIDLRRREHFDRVLDARDPGELLEHATLLDEVFDERVIGIDALFVVGDEFFNYPFRPENGWGHGGSDQRAVDYTPRPHRLHRGLAGGPDAFACSSCHSKGGPDGAGTQSQNGFLRGDGERLRSADQRNAPHLLGLGPIEALAREMSAALQVEATAVRTSARHEGRRIERPLVAKGVSFGRLAADPDGNLDVAMVEGIDHDLRVRPFGWKGHQSTLRGMIEESLHIHQGLVSKQIHLAVKDGTLNGAPYGTGPWYDLDGDGVSLEIDAGMLSTVVGYLAQLEVPVMRPPRDPGLLDAFASGRARFDGIGCATCHIPALELEDPRVDVRQPAPAEARPYVVDVARDGDGPKIEPKYGGSNTSYLVHLFSDLKRHDMGDALASPSAQGAIPARVFLTRPLWGLAESAPYLHDGRAPTLDEAIILHGGEAAMARDRYLALDDAGRASVRIFLTSLTRQAKLFSP